VRTRRLRDAVPEHRRRVYDVRAARDHARRRRQPARAASRLRARHGDRARAHRGSGPVGLLANDPTHLGGAIDADGADAAARLLQLCDAYGLPVVVLCDTPGFMVGPDAERDAGVRHFSRMFVAGAALEVPLVCVVTRKAYGLGAQAMMGGHLHGAGAHRRLADRRARADGPRGGGAARLPAGARGIDDPDERAAREEAMIELAHANADGLNVASFFEIDDVIDPADTRYTITAAPS
jgi:acetyl-CoA carboxylase carboxyltransferase component